MLARRGVFAMMLATVLTGNACADDVVTGTVRLRGIEGGCWVVETAGAPSRILEPIGLPEALRKDGQRVTLRVRPFDGGTICMVGRPVEVIGVVTPKTSGKRIVATESLHN